MAGFPGTDGKEDLQNHYEVFARLRKELAGRTFSPNTFLPGISRNREDETRDLAWWRELEIVLAEFLIRTSRSYCFRTILPPLLELQMQIRSRRCTLKNKEYFDLQHGTLLQARLHTLLSNSNDLAAINNALEVYFNHYGVQPAFMVLYRSIGTSVDCAARLC